MNKKTLVISITAILAAVAIFSAVMFIRASRVKTAVEPKSNNVISGLEEPTLMSSILRDRNFAASPTDGSSAPSETSALEDDTEDPVYNASNIPAVTGLKRLGEQSDSINLVWNDTKGVKGYRVYWRRSGVKDAVYTLFSTVKRAGLDVRNLSAGAKYDFKVVAFISDEYGSYEGKAAEAAFATVPTAVKGFKLKAADEDSTTISWSKNAETDGYILQRCFGGVWSDYKTLKASETEFTDTGLEGGRAYFYRICTYRKDNEGTLKSETKDVYTVAGLTAPGDNGSTSRMGRVSLNYTESEYADGYDIYFSEDNKKWELLSEVTDTRYTSEALNDGDTYYFRVYPYRNVSYLKVTGPYLSLTFTAENEIYDKQVGNTFIEVSLDDQHMWYVKDGELLLDSPVVSGNRNTMDTPTGYFSILSKSSPCTLRGDDYVSYVDYWMAFIGGSYGLHDASWRSSFGGDIYDGDGSHGCVNLPTEVAKELYATAEVGTPVIVY